METINVKPWGEGQGEFVRINKADFDPAVHELHEPETGEPAAPKGKPAKAPKAPA